MDQTTAELTAGAVRAELARRRISGRQLAKALGWTHSTTFRRLSGSSPLNINELAAVADFLGVAPSALIVTGEARKAETAA